MEPLESGQKEKVYLLNEGQAMFLMTLLRNDGVNGVVVKFKARLASKENRLKETDVIKLLVEYAKEQDSTHSDKLYLTYTKLANSIVSGKRDDMTASELNTLTLVERIIKQTIEIDMSMGMHYKDIYKDCKQRIKQFTEITYLSA
ncbi:MAG: hypothetical protein K2P21_05805 [Lachnospiraceae bacterium]|nr:hypothetical protein [Lachnospiraceae bacterium]